MPQRALSGTPTRTSTSGFRTSRVIDLTGTRVWDASWVAALDAIGTRCAQRGKSVEIVGPNTPSAHLHGRLSRELTAGH